MSLLLWIAYTLGRTLLGFIAGVLFTRLILDTRRIAEATEQGFYPFLDCGGAFMADDELPTEDLVRKAARRRAVFNPRLVIGLVVVMLGILTAVQGIVTSNRVAALQQCQAHYSNGFADALDARTKASNDSQHAMDDLVRTIGQHVTGKPEDQAAINAAVSRYVAQRQTAAKQRRAHPLPPPPRESCRNE